MTFLGAFQVLAEVGVSADKRGSETLVKGSSAGARKRKSARGCRWCSINTQHPHRMNGVLTGCITRATERMFAKEGGRKKAEAVRPEKLLKHKESLFTGIT